MRQIPLLLVLMTLSALISSITCGLNHGALVTADGEYQLIRVPQGDFTVLPETFGSHRVKRTIDEHELRSIKSRKRRRQSAPRKRRAAAAAPLDNIKKKKATEQLVGVVKDMMEQVPLTKRPAVRNALREVQKDLNNNKPGLDTNKPQSRGLLDTETQIRRPPSAKPPAKSTAKPKQPLALPPAKQPAKQPVSVLPTPPPASAIAQKLKVKRAENQLHRVQKAYDKEKEKSAARVKAKIEKLVL